MLFFDLVQLQGKEEQLGVYLCAELLDRLQEAPVLRSAHVGRVGQLGKAREAHQAFLDGFIAGDRFGELFAVELCQAPGIVVAEGLGLAVDGLTVGAIGIAVGRRIEIREIPSG